MSTEESGWLLVGVFFFYVPVVLVAVGIWVQAKLTGSPTHRPTDSTTQPLTRKE